MNRTIVLTIALITISIGAYYLGSRSKTDIVAEPTSSPTSTPMPSLSPMEEHMKLLDDGHTIMMMGGTYNPKVIQVSPGSTIKVLNHEKTPMGLMSDDHETFTTSFIEAGGEDTFNAPQKPGSYPFHLHPKGSDQLISGGILIVEM